MKLCHRLLLRIRPAFLASWLKALLRVRRVEVEVAGLRFAVDPLSDLGRRLGEEGRYEEGITAALEKHLRPGDTFVDLGSNEGYFAVVGARLVGPGGRVVAVEPQARLAPVISRNLELNGLGDVVTVDPVCLSDHAGEGELALSPDMNTGATGLFALSRWGWRRQPVEILTLDIFLGRHDLAHVHVMKIDIESFEYEVIMGSPDVFRQNRVGVIALELHRTLLRRRGLDYHDITAFLEGECGYTRDAGLEEVALVYLAPGRA